MMDDGAHPPDRGRDARGQDTGNKQEHEHAADGPQGQEPHHEQGNDSHLSSEELQLRPLSRPFVLTRPRFDSHGEKYCRIACSICGFPTAPTILPFSSPFRKKTSVGIPLTRNRAGVARFSSTFIFAKVISDRIDARDSITGATWR